MNKPIPINHMMTWGAVTGALVLLVYTLIFNFGALDFTDMTQLIIIITGIGGFGGYSLGALSGMLLGFTLAGHSEEITRDALYNRQWHAYTAVFLSVFLVGFALVFAIPAFVPHPLTLSLVAGLTALGATRHYLYRMEKWLNHEKPKRKENTVDVSSQRLEDVDDHDIDAHIADPQSERARKR